MSKLDNKKKLEEIHERLDKKAKIFYVAYKNNRLDLNKLNDDMKNRVLKLAQEENGGKYNRLVSKLKEQKIQNIKNAIDNIDKSSESETIEKDEEPELSEKIIVKFNDFKSI